MQYRMLTNLELVQEAERDARFMTDPLFAELAARVREQKDQGSMRNRTGGGGCGTLSNNYGAVLPTDGIGAGMVPSVR